MKGGTIVHPRLLRNVFSTAHPDCPTQPRNDWGTIIHPRLLRNGLSTALPYRPPQFLIEMNGDPSSTPDYFAIDNLPHSPAAPLNSL